MKKRHKILVVEDETSIQNIITRALESCPYDFVRTRDGKEAVRLAGTNAPDLVLLDVNIPRKNGLEVLQDLRRDIHTRMIPVILITANAAMSDKVGGLAMGADDYMTKPFDLSELRARVERVLQRNQLELAASPLTKLPGSPTIEEEVSRRIEQRTPFAFFYIDINHFKSYNDAYGFAEGNRVIQETAAIILKSLADCGGEDVFAGHVGGDDFAAITGAAAAPFVAQNMVRTFDDAAPCFYNSLDRRRGYIEGNDRQGRPQRFPLITLSIGIVKSDQRAIKNYARIVEIAAQVKAIFKRRPSRTLSQFAFDRRSDF